jgi:hypothetical protein
MPESGSRRGDSTRGEDRVDMSRDTRDSERPTLSGGTAESERRPGLRPLGGAVARLARPIVAKGGGLLARLKAEWPAIVGAELAAATWPSGLSRDGVLKLRVASGQALEVQHRTPLLIERINLFLGREALTRIVLVQGPLPLPARRQQPASPPLSAAETRALDDQLAPVSDPELRDALARLGRRIVGAARRSD